MQEASQFGIIGNDQRNLGGRIQIVQHLKNHHKHLLKAKPRLNTRIPPKKHISKRAKQSKKGKQKLKNAYEMEEVVQNFKKVANMKKGYVDTSAPKTINVKKLRKPGRYKNQKKFIQSEHERNLKHLKRKLGRVGKSMKERKKNPYDPVAHPVRFMRRDPLDPMTGKVADKMGIGVENLANQLIQRRDVVQVDNSGILRAADRKRMKMSSRSGFAEEEWAEEEQEVKEAENRLEEEKIKRYKFTMGESKLVFVDQIPVCEAISELGIEDFKRDVLDVIVEHTLYKDKELEVLFHELKRKNVTKLGEEKIDRVIDEIKAVLDD